VATTIVNTSQHPPPVSTFADNWHDSCVATCVPTLDAPNVGMGFACVATSVPTLEAAQVGTSLAWVATSVPMLVAAQVGMRIACV
jgi:hypothetical protein